MARLARLLALLAAIMLVIGGAPAVAASQPCNPCPPDCPMMQQMADQAAHHGNLSDQDGKANNPCKPDVACQVSASMTAPLQAAVAITLTTAALDLRPGDPLAAPSRPPDRSLRPPIQL
jgi:hypothetical protein